MNAVLAAAVSLKGVDLALVTLAQTLRLLAMVIVAPRLITWPGPRRAALSRDTERRFRIGAREWLIGESA